MRLGIRIDRRETTEDTKRRVPPARGRLGLRVKGSAVALKGFHPGEARDARGRWTEGPDTGGNPPLPGQNKTGKPELPLIEDVRPITGIDRNNYGRIFKAEFQKLKKEIGKGLYCPAVNGRQVVLTKKKHIKNPRGRRRPLSEVMRRISLMPFIVPIIKSGIKTEERRNDPPFEGFYHAVSAKIEGGKREARVVLTDHPGDKLLYLSIMEARTR